MDAQLLWEISFQQLPGFGTFDDNVVENCFLGYSDDHFLMKSCSVRAISYKLFLCIKDTMLKYHLLSLCLLIILAELINCPMALVDFWTTNHYEVA